MKFLLHILTIGVLFSCSSNSNEDRTLISEIEPSMDSTLSVGDCQFVSLPEDSSYVDYWCSSEILKTTSEKIDELDLNLVAAFLATINSRCRNNAEYSQWSNELLFEICSLKPEFVHQLLTKNSSLDRDEIISELESPIHDGIDLDKTLEGFHNLEALELEDSETWKTKMIQAIDKAKEKST